MAFAFIKHDTHIDFIGKRRIAYAISKRPERSNMFWVLIITMPTWINMMVRTYAWVGILQDNGLINSILGLFGIGPVKMMYTTFAVVLGMVYNFIPFMILQIHTSLTKMDKSYLEAAADLGDFRHNIIAALFGIYAQPFLLHL